jgi:hypothetical protein
LYLLYTVAAGTDMCLGFLETWGAQDADAASVVVGWIYGRAGIAYVHVCPPMLRQTPPHHITHIRRRVAKNHVQKQM